MCECECECVCVSVSVSMCVSVGVCVRECVGAVCKNSIDNHFTKNVQKSHDKNLCHFLVFPSLLVLPAIAGIFQQRKEITI